MYSLGVYVVPLEEEDDKPENFGLADPTCRKDKRTVLYKNGDRSNVNTHPVSKNLSFALCT